MNTTPSRSRKALARCLVAGLLVSTALACTKTPAPEPAVAVAAPKPIAAVTAPPAPTPAAPAASACSTGTWRASRMQTNGDSCIDYRGSAWSANMIKDQSSQNGWAPRASACPTANSVGACAYSIASMKNMESVQRHYVSSRMTAAQAEAYCKGNPAMTGVFCP